MKLIILDRDGVINQDSDAFIKCPDEWIPLPRSLDAIALLNTKGYTVAVATNQSGVGRGLYDLQTLAAIHEKMLHSVREAGGEIAGIFSCPHAPDAGCDCRKPAMGLFYQIQHYFQCDLTKTLSVGDSLRDLQAAKTAGCSIALVKTGNGAALIEKGSLPDDCLIFDDLFAVAQSL